MVLDIVIYSLHENPPVEDEGPYSSWYPYGKAFVDWLNDGNAVYRYLGDPHHLDKLSTIQDFTAVRKHVGERTLWFAEHGWMSRDQACATVSALESDELLARLLAGDVVDIFLLDERLDFDRYERPKDFALAQQWIQQHVQPEAEKQRMLDMLNLLQCDDGLWLYESW